MPIGGRLRFEIGDISGSSNHKRDRIRRPRLVPFGADPYHARSPCPRCQSDEAFILRRGNQATVRCASCHRHLYDGELVADPVLFFLEGVDGTLCCKSHVLADC